LGIRTRVKAWSYWRQLLIVAQLTNPWFSRLATSGFGIGIAQVVGFSGSAEGEIGQMSADVLARAANIRAWSRPKATSAFSWSSGSYSGMR
jgi:hypothetical protein